MDDNFNTNNLWGGATPENTPSPAQNTPPKAAEDHSAPMGTMPSGNANYGAPYNQPYSAPYNAPYNPQQAQYNQTPYNAGNTQYSNIPGYTQNAYRNPNPAPKKKKNTGRNIFVAFVCICIVIASLAIGLSVSEENGTDTKTEQSDNGSNKKNDKTSGATAKTEDSPITFSEYSGKGAMTPEQIYEEAKEINVGVIVYAQNQKVGEGSGIIVGEDKDKKNTYQQQSIDKLYSAIELKDKDAKWNKQHNHKS